SIKLKNLSKKDTIYIFPGGASYYSRREYALFDELELGIKCIRSRFPSEISNKVLTAYLNSSLLIWYSLNKLESIDFFRNTVFANLRIPNNKKFDFNENFQKIEGLVDIIIKEEIKILKEIIKIISKKNFDRENLEIKINKHNDIVSGYAYEIDNIFYEVLGIDKEKKQLIENYLRTNYIYLYGKE
ncbi:MAG: hypothetical protein MUO34_02480, partial [Ignavibacteriaceae bacterium]|nr:hypothetical protein [Ignavibacteriaceae bacterium]